MSGVTFNVTLRMGCSELRWDRLVLKIKVFLLFFRELNPSLDLLKSLFGGGGES